MRVCCVHYMNVKLVASLQSFHTCEHLLLCEFPAGPDTVDAGAGTNFIIGGLSSDQLKAGPHNDVICGDSCSLVFASVTTPEYWVVGTLDTISPVDGGMQHTVTSQASFSESYPCVGGGHLLNAFSLPITHRPLGGLVVALPHTPSISLHPQQHQTRIQSKVTMVTTLSSREAGVILSTPAQAATSSVPTSALSRPTA